MPTWLNHDYEDGGVVDILAVVAYSGVGGKSFSNFFQNSSGHIP
jgi:hypothetical protein